MNVLDPRLAEDVAARLGSDPALIEKDWYVTRAIAVLAALNHGGAAPALGGGSLRRRHCFTLAISAQDAVFVRIFGSRWRCAQRYCHPSNGRSARSSRPPSDSLPRCRRFYASIRLADATWPA